MTKFLLIAIVIFSACNTSQNTSESQEKLIVTETPQIETPLLEEEDPMVNWGQNLSDKLFIEHFKEYCGQRITGKVVFPNDAAISISNKSMFFEVNECKENRVVCEYHLDGDSLYRAWLIDSKFADTCYLKHDFLTQTGERVNGTFFGGRSIRDPKDFIQVYPSDDFTKKIIADSETNEWVMAWDYTEQTFIYALYREKKLRFKSVFDLKTAEDL